MSFHFNLDNMKYAHCRSFFVGNASTRIISLVDIGVTYNV